MMVGKKPGGRAGSVKLAGLQFVFHLVMAAQKPHLDAVVQVQEQEPEGAGFPTLEEVSAQLANTNSAVLMWAAEGVRQFQECVPAFVPVSLGQRRQPVENRRPNDGWFLHASFAGRQG